jgi:hypothetical protein
MCVISFVGLPTDARRQTFVNQVPLAILLDLRELDRGPMRITSRRASLAAFFRIERDSRGGRDTRGSLARLGKPIGCARARGYGA